jgi:hypothetical protein
VTGFELAGYYILQISSFILPWVVGGQVVCVLGSDENRLWISKELIGTLVAVDLFIPFAVVFYPDTFHLRPVSMDLWTLRSSAWHALAYLISYIGLTMIGIARWDWHQPDVWPWSLHRPKQI